MEEEKKIKVLVADDNESILTLLRVQLISEGYEPVLARNGKEALEKVYDTKPDIILLDVMMPEKNGFEVAKEIKEDKEYNYIPIIMVTARAEFESKTTGIESGADDYVTKPIDFKNLLLKIKALLRIKELNEEVRLQKEKMEKELQLAKKLQEKLLSFPIPEFSKIELYSKYISSSNLSGDIFFIKEIDKEKCFFVVADVSCEGVESALIMLLFNSFLRYGIEKYGAENIEELMFFLNNELLNMDINNNFITVFAGIIDAPAGKLKYISAGHIDAFIYKDKEKYEILPATSSLLGGFFTVEFKAKEIKLSKNDKLLVFTKGLLESIDQKLAETLDSEKTAAILNDSYNDNLKFMLDNVLKNINENVEKDIILLGFQLK